MRKMLLRLAMPAASILSWICSHGVWRAHSLGTACVLLLMAIAAACLERPFRMERLPARFLFLLLIWPSGMTNFVAAYVGPCNRLEMTIVSAAFLLLFVFSRFVLIWFRLPRGRTRTFDAVGMLSPRFARFARAELALLWFGLFRWRQRISDNPSTANAFPTTGTGIETAMCWLTAFGFLVEIPLLHVLLAHVWSMAAAWTCSGLHTLLFIYMIGYAKSLSFKPTLLFPDRIEIRLGVLARRVVLLEAIEGVSPCDTRKARQPDEQRLFGMDGPNLRLSTEGAHILFRVDEPARLIKALA